MRAVLEGARQIAVSPQPVLLLGETGVGKERVARFIHEQGPWWDGPFIAVNCGGIPAQLLVSEMFGHAKGAFTGADADRLGHFRAAAGGTLFLDEVGDLTSEGQAALLRALDGREATPLGSSQPYPLECRVLAATERDLTALRDAGGFRPALYYRLASSRIKIPPLRERREDVVPLARAFLDALRRRGEVDGEYLGPEAARNLLAHRWPGNVRELQNAVRAAVYAKGPSGMGHIGRFLDGSGGPERLGTHQEMREALGREPSALELQVVCELEARWRCSIRTLADVLCVNRETLRRRLEPLIRMGIVARGGQGRGAWVEMGRGE